MGDRHANVLLRAAGAVIPVAVGIALVPARPWLGTANTENGMPSTEIELEVRGGGRSIARFVLTARAVDPDRLRTAAAVADQVGSCLASGGPTIRSNR